MRLFVYITNWKVPTNRITNIKNELSSLSRNLTEFRKGTGVPTFIEPLLLMLKNLTEIKEYDISVNIISNIPIEIEFCDFLSTSPNKSIEIQNNVYDVSLLDSPFELSNQYINYFKRDLAYASENDIFVYLEHDQLFTQSNLDYFKRYSGFLDEYNLRPGYARIEWNHNKSLWYSSDIQIPKNGLKKEINFLNYSQELVFLTLPNPYFGFSVHSVKSAKRFFDSMQDFSYLLKLGQRWGITEQSAMTDLLHTASSSIASDLNFNSIAPIAFNLGAGQIEPGALAWHLSNRYANTATIIKRLRKYGNLTLGNLNTHISEALSKKQD
jgi:hypothetical protein